MIEVYDNLLDKSIADQISGEMSALKWEFEHYSTSNVFKPNIHWHIPCGDSLDNVKLDSWGPIIENHTLFPLKTNVHFVW